MIQFVFNSIKRDNSLEIAKCVKELYSSEVPVIVCVGSDLIIGDSLGPLVGSRLLKRLNGKAYVYGTLDYPITAKEVKTIYEKIKLLHPRSKTIVVDAAVGNKEDVGQVKISNTGIKPGLAVNKDLPLISNVSIIGVVCGKSEGYNKLYSGIRLSLVEAMANDIVNGLSLVFDSI
ncbi:MAG: spore protease YyaC [Clostridia bacterium]|nr:spore protease YyaC [Clostridia bacterium]